MAVHWMWTFVVVIIPVNDWGVMFPVQCVRHLVGYEYDPLYLKAHSRLLNELIYVLIITLIPHLGFTLA